MDGTVTTQDTATSADNQGTSNNQTPETFTKEQVDKLISDSLSKAGRDAKSLETRKAELDKREAASREAEAQRQREKEEKELAELEEATKDNPEEKPKLIDFKKNLANEKKTFNAEKAKVQPILDVIKELGIADANELKEVITQSRETGFQLIINETASRHNIDATVLKDKSEKLGLNDKDRIEELASSLPKKTAIPPPDSGKTSGGGIDTSKMTPEQKIRYGMEHLKK